MESDGSLTAIAQITRLATHVREGRRGVTEKEIAMAFMQIIEFETDSVDEMVRLGAEWSDRAVAAGATARRGIVGTDRDKPGRCFQIVFFDSYESAMKNSDLPITHEFAQKMGALAKGEASFYNLDIVDDRTW